MADLSTYRWSPEFKVPEGVLPPYCDPKRTVSRALRDFEPIPMILETVTPGWASILLTVSYHSGKVIDTSTLKTALLDLRRRHPAIAIIPLTVKETGNIDLFTYSSPSSDEEASSWLNQVVVSHPNSTSIEKTLNALGEAGYVNDRPKFAVYLHHVPKSDTEGHFVFDVRHDVFDGISAIEMADEFLHSLEEVILPTEPKSTPAPWGEEVSRLALPLPFRVTPTGDPDDMELTEADQRIINERFELMGQQSDLGVPHDQSVSPLSSHFMARILSQESTSQFVVAARERHTTFFPLSYAVFCLAVHKLSPPINDDKPRRATVGIYPISIRETLAAERPGDRAARQFVSTQTFGGWSALLPACGASDTEIVDSVLEQISKNATQDRLAAFRSYVWMDHFCIAMAKLMKEGLSNPSPPPPDTFPAISSIGRIDKNLTFKTSTTLSGVFESLHARNPLPTNVVCHYFTTAGQLRLGFSYPSSVYSEGAINKFADIWVEVFEAVGNGQV